MKYFVDTSALIALKDAGDRHHRRAVSFLEEWMGRERLALVITNYILAEVHAYFCRAPRVALQYAEYLLHDPLFHLVRACPADERQALTTLRAAHDKSYSWTDAVSFAVMDRLGLTSALAFDRHFEQAGRFHIQP